LPAKRDAASPIAAQQQEHAATQTADDLSAVRAVFMEPARELPPEVKAKPLVQFATSLRDVLEGGEITPLMEKIAAAPESLIALEQLTGRDEELNEYLATHYKVGLMYEPAVDRMYRRGYEHPDLFLDAIFALMPVSDGYMAEGIVGGWHDFLIGRPEFLLEHRDRITGPDAPALASLCSEYLPETRQVLTAHFRKLQGKPGVQEVLEWLACEEQ
jgi:hypothetical protein